MNHVPNWWEAMLLVGGALRLWVLLSSDRILDGPRTRLLCPVDENDQPQLRETLQEFMDCPWCLGNWCLGAWWIFWLAFPHVALVIAALFAMGWVVGAVGART